MFQYYLDLIVAAKRELIRFRFGVAVLFTIILLAVLFVGSKWPQRYVSTSVIAVDVTNVIEPLLRGAAEVTDLDVTEKVGDVISSKRVLEAALLRIYPEAAGYSPQRLENEVKQLRSNLGIVVSRRRPHTVVSFGSASPTGAYESLTAIVDVFLEDRVAEKQKDSFEAYNFINAQVVEYKKQLESAEQKLKAFKAQSVDASESDVRKRVNSLTAEIKDLQVEIEETEETIRTTRRQLKTEGQYLEVRSRSIALEERRKSLQDELDRLRLSYQDSYPDVMALKRQLAELDEALRVNLEAAGLQSAGQASELPLYEELRKQASSAEVQVLTQRRRLAALESQLEDEYRLAGQVADRQAELLDLTRDYDVTKSVYEEMLERKENAKLTVALNNEGQGENYKLIESPNYPLSPSGLNPIVIFLLAPILAAGFPLGLVFVYVFLDPRIRSSSQLRSILPEGVGLLASIPYQSTPLGVRLMRKDMILLGLWVVCLMGFYGYLAYIQIIGQVVE